MARKAEAIENNLDNTIAYSHLAVSIVLDKVGAVESGLTSASATARIRKYGQNTLKDDEKNTIFKELLRRVTDPLVLTLIVVSIVSYIFGGRINAVIVIMMALLSVILSFVQEHRASKNAQKLAEMVKIKCQVLRDGKEVDLNLSQTTIGDIIVLNAGDMIPADCRVIESTDLFVNQAALNGESFPVHKNKDIETNGDLSVYDLKNMLFLGSSVVSGFGKAVVVSVGKQTELGKLSKELGKSYDETAFDRGIKGFISLMLRFIFILCISIFLINSIFKKDIVEALLFSLAVAIGLAPEMLPMITTVTLSRGAIRMSKKKVIVKHLDSMQNFGAMNTLCTDKTGTLTMNEVSVVKHCDAVGKEDEYILKLAYVNSHFQTGLKNLLDFAILKHEHLAMKEYKKIGEIPYDFERKMVSIAVEDGKNLLISKGAPEEILKRCRAYNVDGKIHSLTKDSLEKINTLYDDFGKDGYRVLAVSEKVIGRKDRYSHEDEKDLIFKGFVAFLDPPKPTVVDAIKSLEEQGIALKILTGDNELVTKKVCKEVGLIVDKIYTGTEIDKYNDSELKTIAKRANIFARLDPLQKERIIKALQGGGDVVGFIGDGINDAPALKIADVGISVDNACDIAKETASIILLEKDLRVLSNCVAEGRKTFANVIKYIKMGASSNLGNMISMTGASLFLPFLPMLPGQVLLNNFLYDVSQVAIPSDGVDPDYLKKPRPWDIGFIKNFMLFIGPISSIFDFATFGVMWYVFHASPELFRSGWFVESLCTQTLVVHIIRTSKIPFIQSRSSKFLLFTTLIVVLIGAIIPYTPLGKVLGFAPLPWLFFAILISMAIVYLLLVQIAKVIFIKKFGYE